MRVRCYAVTIEGLPPPTSDIVAQDGRERGPYVAETYLVTVEQRHAVVDVPDRFDDRR